MSLKAKITEDMKIAMREKDAPRLGTIRLLLSAIKQIEVDQRIELSDSDIVAIIEKMLKQRRDSITQFEAGGRQDLADQEKLEATILQTYMPQALSEGEISAAIDTAIRESGASAVAEMGKVMAILKPQLAGRADMARVSQLVKTKLGG